MSKTHWKKLSNPDYLGAYSLEPGQEMVLTIKSVTNEMVNGADGKKEECIVAKFTENVKPMILNATNAKTITKLYKTPYIEEWSDRKIQIYADKIKAFGETVEALRIRQFEPKSQISCEDCGVELKAYKKMSPMQLGQYTKQKYGRMICAECAKKLTATDSETGVTE